MALLGATKPVGKGTHCLNGICSLHYTQSKDGETHGIGTHVIPMGTARPLGEGRNSTLCHSVGVHHGVPGCSQLGGEGERHNARAMSRTSGCGICTCCGHPTPPGAHGTRRKVRVHNRALYTLLFVAPSTWCVPWIQNKIWGITFTFSECIKCCNA